MDPHGALVILKLKEEKWTFLLFSVWSSNAKQTALQEASSGTTEK